jgi:UDP-glucose 4-epimerase
VTRSRFGLAVKRESWPSPDKKGKDDMTKRHVVVTGAAGLIASLLLPALRSRYDLTLLDARREGPDGKTISEVQIVDLLDRNRDAYRRHFRGADAIVHCGFVRAQDPSNIDQQFFAELSNVALAYNVYQTAWEENVQRVVVASSNHAADYYERLILGKLHDFVLPDDRPLSDNFYGWAKDAYEHLGFVFATANLNGRPLENVQIRIGGPRETDVAACRPGDLTCMRRALAVYISQRDMAQLFIKSIEAKDIRDANGVPFQVFYGISDNPHAFWSIVNARRVIDYAPEDNSEIRFSDQIADHLRAFAERQSPC